nr:integrase, catalytic region, zinc finger, CCHC-type, peptidase aspartic, catalytic [Tanacetum cinerariifolium]
MHTQTLNTLHNAIMEAGGKDCLPMLAPGNYIQWKSRIKRYIDTKSNHELIHYCLKNPPYKYTCADKVVSVFKGSSKTTIERIDNDIYSIVDACRNACEIWKAIERLKQGESINVQDLETNLYWEFRKFTSRDSESLESYYSRFYKMMNELVRNQCDSQELKTVSYHKLYDILKQHQNEVNELRAERLARTANPLALVAQQQPVYHPQNHHTHYTRTSSNTSRANQDNSTRINRGTGYENQRICNVSGAKETVAYHKEKMLLCKQEEAGFQLNAEQADWRDDIDDEYEDQEREAHYMYMAHIQEVTPDAAGDYGPIFDSEPLHKLDQDDDDDLANEHELLASLNEKLKCEIDDSKNHSKFLETSNKVLVDKLKGEIKDFKTKNKSLESSNNHFKEANNKLSETNELMYNDLKKFQAKLDRRSDVKYASNMEINYAKAKGDLMSYKMESEKSFNQYTQKINDLNQTILEMKKELFAHQETISILSQAKEAQIKLCKTREDKELDKVIALENKVKILDNIVYKTGQSVQTMNMLNRNCKTSFSKPEFLKKAQRVNPRLYDIGCYNDNLALMLEPKSDEVIRVEKESQSKLSDLIRPFDYEKLNNLYDLFVPQREKSSEQRYFSERSKMSHTHVNNGNSKESFNKQTTLLEKQMDESIPYDQKCKSSKELFKIKRSVGAIIDGVERCKQTIAKRTYFGHIDPFIQNIIEANFCPEIRRINANLEKFHLCLKEEMLVEIILFIVESGCSKHMMGNIWLLINFVEKFLGMVKFRNDQIAPILGYGDLVQGAVTIKRVYYVEGLNHNLFSIGQFCDTDLEVAIQKSTCYV